MAQKDAQNGSSNKDAEEVVFSALKPLLMVEAPNASEAVQFYKAAFGAVETGRTTQPKRKAEQDLPLVISAELELAGSTFVVCDFADDASSVKSEGNIIAFCLETRSVESAIAKAVAAGAVAEGEIGEAEGSCCEAGRVGKVRDPYGFLWMVCSPSGVSACVEA